MILKIFVVIFIFTTLSLFAEENYFIEAGARFKIEPQLLQSIAKVESNFNPNAINLNSNGTLDIGIMQINSIHLPLLSKLGVKQDDLFEPRININFGAYILAKCFDKYGKTINGLNCYNGRLNNNPYAVKILQEFIKLDHQANLYVSKTN